MSVSKYKHRFTISLSKNLFRQIEVESNQLGLTKSSFIELAMTQFLSDYCHEGCSVPQNLLQVESSGRT